MQNLIDFKAALLPCRMNEEVNVDDVTVTAEIISCTNNKQLSFI